MGFLGDGLKDRTVETIEDAGAATSLEYGLDAINIGALELINLAAGFFDGSWFPRKLRFRLLPNIRRHVFEVFGAVSALSREQWPTREEFSPQLFAVVHGRPHLKHNIQRVAN